MLQKSKSKQVKLFKYVLLIPIVFGMLIYTSSYGQEKDKIEQNKSQELEQYTYTVIVRDVRDEQLMVKAKELRQGYIAFLIENPEYVGWAQGDFKSGMTYSIHSIKEKVPKNLEKVSASYNGSPYTMFIESAITGEVITEVEDVEVPFAVIEHVPVFPGCEDLASREEKMDCTSASISEHVSENFDTALATKLGLVGRQRITVLFKISAEGNIVDVQARAPHPALEKEAIRVVNTLPKMLPGKQKGKNVIVPYSLPIVFNTSDTNETTNPIDIFVYSKTTNESEKLILDDVEVPFTVIEHVPVFPGCEDLVSNEEKKKCMSDKIQEFVARNFNTEIASEKGLVGKQRITTLFKIGTDGNIFEVNSRAPHPALEEEVIRVIKLLPKMQPGKQKGKSVVVPYALPIVFVVQDDQPELEKK